MSLRPLIKPYGRFSRIRLSCKVAPLQGATRVGQRSTNSLFCANGWCSASLPRLLSPDWCQDNRACEHFDASACPFPYSRVPSRIHLAIDSFRLSSDILTLL